MNAGALARFSAWDDAAGRGCIKYLKAVVTLSEFKYKPQYAVVVLCEDEKSQKATYEKLHAEGHKLKVVTV